MSTKADHLTISVQDHVAQLVFHRPPANHVSVELVADLADALLALDRDPAVRASVLASDGKPFCAGADLASPTGIGGSGMGGVSDLYDQAIRLFSVEKPIVAAVQGAAVGAGLGLALVADFRVAAPEARFSANFVKLGFHPGFGLTHTLPRVIGAQRADLMFLTGRRIRAEDALAFGLVDELVPANELRQSAFALAAELAENAPLAVVATRRTTRGKLADAVRAATAHEHVQQTTLRATEDFAEGVAAVNERRPGQFKGR
ncbi:MAG: enoyl-CoA hydratase/isomerase family protein [Phenylobacterium sp.]|uniref:enoyl-CoA hydratase/isomerase family protein n=1 Tax=Phenylobacterium sp. TaxID=1871053 RepID=UPI00271746CC|nr:enoyl-CoA hydratase/isomerase family protein [Phenylobacterium sp.]MDO8410433.1 enoyl-CoA hydratase/isomerase family protein [Phenylobacterium sp.]